MFNYSLTNRQLKIVGYAVLLITLTSFDYILYIRWVQTMKNYRWYAGSIVFPLFGCVFFWVPVWYQMFYRKKQFTKESTFSQLELFTIGSFDSLNAILGTYATPYLSVLLMTILDKLTLPLTMVISFCYLGRSYLPIHYLGVFLTLYGVGVSFIPNFDQDDQVKNPTWLGIYILSLLPAVASYCYKEHNLHTVDLDIWWMNAWITVWQVVFGMLTTPVVFASPPVGEGISGSDFGNYFKNATICQFASQSSQTSDRCDYSFLYFISYQLVSTLCNIIMFIIIRDESSVVYQIINTLKMPITAWLGASPYLVGDQAQAISPADIFSFIGISLGVIIYNRKPEIQRSPKRNTSAHDNDLHLSLRDNVI
jgi:hypothetical protein